MFVFVLNEHGNMPVFLTSWEMLTSELTCRTLVPSHGTFIETWDSDLLGCDSIFSAVEVHRRFAGTHRLHLQGSRVSHARLKGQAKTTFTWGLFLA
jgi:hypothetical protein